MSKNLRQLSEFCRLCLRVQVGWRSVSWEFLNNPTNKGSHRYIGLRFMLVKWKQLGRHYWPVMDTDIRSPPDNETSVMLVLSYNAHSPGGQMWSPDHQQLAS